MIEPTEAETKETLDYFIEVTEHIAGEAMEDPETVRGAPQGAANTRLDEAGAARHPTSSGSPRVRALPVSECLGACLQILYEVILWQWKGQECIRPGATR